MAKPHEIIKSVFEAFYGLPEKLAKLTGKSDEIFGSHGREPKTHNPMSSGNVSPVTHFMTYCRQYEAADKGAGAMLSNRVHGELALEFTENVEADCSQKELNQELLKEVFDVLKCFSENDFQNLSTAELAGIETECAELRDKASDAVAHVRALKKIRNSQR